MGPTIKSDMFNCHRDDISDRRSYLALNQDGEDAGRREVELVETRSPEYASKEVVDKQDGTCNWQRES